MSASNSHSGGAVAGAYRPPSSPERLLGLDESFVVALRGDQDRSTIPGLHSLLDRACLSDSADVVIDLSEVGFLDTAVVRVVQECSERLVAESRQLILVSPSRAVRRVLKLCGSTGLLAIDTGHGLLERNTIGLRSWVPVPHDPQAAVSRAG